MKERKHLKLFFSEWVRQRQKQSFYDGIRYKTAFFSMEMTIKRPILVCWLQEQNLVIIQNESSFIFPFLLFAWMSLRKPSPDQNYFTDGAFIIHHERGLTSLMNYSILSLIALMINFGTKYGWKWFTDILWDIFGILNFRAKN